MRLKPLSASILIALALLLSVAKSVNATSGNLRPNQHEKQTREHADSGEHAQPVPTVPLSLYEASQSALSVSLSALHAEQEARAKDNHPSYEPWYAPEVLAQIVLCVIGALYVYYAAKQWAEIWTQSQTAERELIITNRAYLYLSEVHISLSASETDPEGDERVHKYVITYPIYNGGQTPALYVGSFARTTVDYKPPQKVSPNALALDRTQNAVVPPRGAEPLNAPYDSFVSEKEFADIRSGKQSLFFYGVLTYFDVFDKERHTWFALRYNGPLGTKMPMDFITNRGLKPLRLI
jgi:hypothetical protein